VCRPSVVFTCLALFNVLIAPLNAFPWVVNGVVEAFVSLKRIQQYLLLPQRSMEWAYADSVLPEMQEFQHQQQRKWQQQQQQGQLALQHTGHAKTDGAQLLDSRAAGKKEADSSSSSSNSSGKHSAQSSALERGVAAQFDNATFAWKQV
jgi:hypothetical protein